ncbi:uncharacterized protein ACR2FA_000944 [Aphomia sociella]
MLLNNKLSLEEAVVICKQAEIQEEESKLLQVNVDEQEIEINKVRTYKRNADKCWFCGKDRHQREHCPANKVTCHKCKRMGHFAKLCRSRAMRMVEAVENVYKEQM